MDDSKINSLPNNPNTANSQLNRLTAYSEVSECIGYTQSFEENKKVNDFSFKGYTPLHDFYLIECYTEYNPSAFDLLCTSVTEEKVRKISYLELKVVAKGINAKMCDIGDTVMLSSEVSNTYFDGSGNAIYVNIEDNPYSFHNQKRKHLEALKELGFLKNESKVIVSGKQSLEARNAYISSLSNIVVKDYILVREFYVICKIPKKVK